MKNKCYKLQMADSMLTRFTYSNYRAALKKSFFFLLLSSEDKIGSLVVHVLWMIFLYLVCLRTLVVLSAQTWAFPLSKKVAGGFGRESDWDGHKSRPAWQDSDRLLWLYLLNSFHPPQPVYSYLLDIPPPRCPKLGLKASPNPQSSQRSLPFPA